MNLCRVSKKTATCTLGSPVDCTYNGNNENARWPLLHLAGDKFRITSGKFWIGKEVPWYITPYLPFFAKLWIGSMSDTPCDHLLTMLKGFLPTLPRAVGSHPEVP